MVLEQEWPLRLEDNLSQEGVQKEEKLYQLKF